MMASLPRHHAVVHFKFLKNYFIYMPNPLRGYGHRTFLGCTLHNFLAGINYVYCFLSQIVLRRRELKFSLDHLLDLVFRQRISLDCGSPLDAATEVEDVEVMRDFWREGYAGDVIHLRRGLAQPHPGRH